MVQNVNPSQIYYVRRCCLHWIVYDSNKEHPLLPRALFMPESDSNLAIVRYSPLNVSCHCGLKHYVDHPCRSDRRRLMCIELQGSIACHV
jgi:hypothetical protein